MIFGGPRRRHNETGGVSLIRRTSSSFFRNRGIDAGFPGGAFPTNLPRPLFAAAAEMLWSTNSGSTKIGRWGTVRDVKASAPRAAYERAEASRNGRCTSNPDCSSSCILGDTDKAQDNKSAGTTEPRFYANSAGHIQD